MKWFEELCAIAEVRAVLVTDNEGRILRSSRSMVSLAELVASMIQSANVLAQALTEEALRGPLEMFQITTNKEHFLVFPLEKSVFHLLLITELSAPVNTIIRRVEGILPQVNVAELIALQGIIPKPPPKQADDSELNADELIEAVRQWLHGKSLGGL